MDRINSFIISAQTKLQQKVSSLLSKERGDSQIVVALVLIAVAVGLCIIFRNQIKAIMANLTNTIGTSISNLSNGIVE